MKMQAVNPYTGFHIKKKFTKRRIIFILKILFKFFWLKNKLLLHQVSNYRKQHNGSGDIENDLKQ